MSKFKNFLRWLPVFLLIGWGSALMPLDPQPRKMTEVFFPDKDDLDPVTPALQKSKGFTTHQELVDFVTELQRSFPSRVRIEYPYQSHKGMMVPLVRILPLDTSTPSLDLWLQGGLHGDEPASTEGLLYFLYKVLHDPSDARWLDHVTLTVVPMVNVDGYQRQERSNAQGLDLNRDQTKLMATESRPLKTAMSAINPQVAVDFHEYRPFRRDYVHMGSFGVCGMHDVMFLNSSHPNIHPRIREWGAQEFHAPVQKILAQEGITHHDYFTPQESAGRMVFRLGSDNPRSSATNFALQGMIATLVEVRGVGLGRTSFKRRIYTTYLIARTYLQQASIHAQSILAERNQWKITGDSLVIHSRRESRRDSLDFLDIDKNQRIRLGVEIEDAQRQVAAKRISIPVAYGVPAHALPILERLRSFGLQEFVLPAGSLVEAEAFEVRELEQDPVPYEKARIQHLKVHNRRMITNLKEDWIGFRMDQPKALLIPELLEPSASNGFVHFGIIKASLDSTLPVYRLFSL
ncbi:MAG: hypothetical protein RLZZ617_653 [Bacteroidota bacterium]